MNANSTCDRGDASVPAVGAGSDWICMVAFNDNTGQQQSGKFELNVHSNSCYTANGRAKLLGASPSPTPPAGKSPTRSTPSTSASTPTPERAGTPIPPVLSRLRKGAALT